MKNFRFTNPQGNTTVCRVPARFTGQADALAWLQDLAVNGRTSFDRQSARTKLKRLRQHGVQTQPDTPINAG